MLSQIRSFFASTAAPGAFTQLEELLAAEPGSLRRITEPLMPFEVMAGSWPHAFSHVARFLPASAGIYILVSPAAADEAEGQGMALSSVYVGKSGDLRQRLRDHFGDPRRRTTTGFALVSSPPGELTGHHCCALEAILQQVVSSHEAVALEGRTEGLIPLSTRDRLIVTTAASALVRMLRHSGLLLPDFARALQPAAEPPEPAPPLTVHAELRFLPNAKTPFADLCLLGAETSRGFLLRAGSDFRVESSHEQPRSITARREQLMSGGYLEAIPGVSTRLRLTRDVLMFSASVAARVMCGYAVSNVLVHGAWYPVEAGLPEIR